MTDTEKRQRFSMIRTFVPADLITLGNAGCGTTAIFMCLMHVARPDSAYLLAAFALLPLAFVLDALDGFVARKTKRSSPLGADLDSLADTISFGVAPAALAFTLGMRGGWDAVILVYFVCCGVARLARFNVTAEELADETTGKVKYFEGTPIPTFPHQGNLFPKHQHFVICFPTRVNQPFPRKLYLFPVNTPPCPP